jgi:F-type H+-transporting ATPase subunit a
LDVSIEGPKILFKLPILGGINITESVVNTWIAMAIIAVFCLWITKDMKVQNPGKKQIIAEKIVMFLRNLVKTNMGDKWMNYVPFVGMLLSFSAVSSMLSITGLRSPTADFSVTLGMALTVFVLIQFYQFKSKGPIGFFTRLAKPVAIMTPMNIVGEISTPLSMSMRHFGNIASGTVLTTLIYASLASFSHKILGAIPNDFFANIPILQIGLPAILSIYFDLFSSCVQAYIFCMLAMANISSAVD